MSWQKLNDDEPELYYHSNAVKEEDVKKDLLVVLHKMKTNRLAERAEKADSLLFYFNATNGFISIVWFNSQVNKPTGTWMYQLLLETLWEASLEHEDGAFYFDKTCRYAVCDYLNDDILENDGQQRWSVFIKTELNGIEELFI